MARPFGTKDIETPEALWLLFEDYKKTLETIKLTVPHVKLGTVDIDVKEPMTMDGFYSYGYDNQYTIHNYIDNPDNRYEDYKEIVTRIKNQIYKHNFSRAAVGLYKEALIAKQLGLKEKIETTNIEQPLFPEIKKDT